MTVGIRPEDVGLGVAGGLVAPVEPVEPTGHGIILHLRVQDQPFKVLTNDRRYLTPDATASVVLPADRLQPLRRRRQPSPDDQIA